MIGIGQWTASLLLAAVRRDGHAGLLRAGKCSRWFVLAFAGSCVLASAYGFLQGAWPFGLVEGIWSLVALRRWRVALPASSDGM